MIYAGLGDELLSRGYALEQLPLGGRYRQYISPNGKVAITKTAHYEYPFMPRVTKTISQDKELSYALAKFLNVSVPATLRSGSLHQASDFLDKYKRIIIKPAEKGGGQGLSLNITENSQLSDALSKATFGDSLPLIQEQFMGDEIRFTVISGRVQSAILRQTPRVVGDGHTTVAELIKIENKVRETLIFPLLTYPQLTGLIIPKHFLHDSRVLGKLEVVELNNSTMIRNGASFYGISESVHPSYVEIAERLADRLNPTFLVVDLMIKQWKSKATANNYIFLEFNTAPALAVYSSIRGGDKPNIIALIANLIDEYAKLSK